MDCGRHNARRGGSGAGRGCSSGAGRGSTESSVRYATLKGQAAAGAISLYSVTGQFWHDILVMTLHFTDNTAGAAQS